ncbi:coagulation factor X-like isoform X7 [Heterodontus francisci]|uniref:coagulation factor X-like isoform X7 n=1 Tax=Heterodontus francisci TaxID=7792 RepID=UPI00355B2155
MAWILGLVLSLLVPAEAYQQVFLPRNAAQTLLSRQKRKNFLLEELRPGNLERECIEEQCNFEEAREVFEDMEKTLRFMSTYTGPKDCSSHGHTCDHFCKSHDDSYVCYCAQGYKLGEDQKSCIPEVPYPCGKVMVPSSIQDTDLILRAINGDQQCRRGEYPWQVLLKHDNEKICAGAILNKDFVLTSADCVNQLRSFTVVVGEHNLEVDEGSEQTLNVSHIHIHSRYSQATFENDLALLRLETPIEFNNYTIPICLPETDFAEFFLMNSEYGAVSGWKLKKGRVEQPVLLGLPYVPYIKYTKCEGLQHFPIVHRMFCAGFEELVDPLCYLTRGGPFVTKYRSVWYLTGMSLGVEKYDCNMIPVYTKVSRYINWIKKIMAQSLSGL